MPPRGQIRTSLDSVGTRIRLATGIKGDLGYLLHRYYR